MLSAPTSTAPAASSRSISVASRVTARRSRLIFEPARVVRPLTSNRFFTANGTPASGPTFLPAAIVGIDRAGRGAGAFGDDVGEGVQHADRALAIRASAASVASSADSCGPLPPGDLRRVIHRG